MPAYLPQSISNEATYYSNVIVIKVFQWHSTSKMESIIISNGG